MIRNIIRIDEEKCNGCAQCVHACAEGAIRIIDGKARLVSNVYCDGLGACIGECPQGALTIEEREADEFDEQAVKQHLSRQTRGKNAASENSPGKPDTLACGCPGSASQTLRPREPASSRARSADGGAVPSALGNWPVQLHLVPEAAPYLKGAHLVISADCVPFAFADFHKKFLSGRALVVGCPKLDDTESYREKLALMFRQNDFKAIEVLFMEVPCCSGLVHTVRSALKKSGADLPLTLTRIGIRGKIIEEKTEQ